MFITNGPIADVAVVYAKTEKDQKHTGISAFIVEKDTPGFSAGKNLNKMGVRSSHTSELIFDDCKVPKENLIGQERAGFLMAMQTVEVTARIFGRLVAVYGTPDQKDEIIPSLQEGRLIGAVAISEDAMNIENDPLNTSAVNNDEGFLVSGSKGHVVNGPIADWIAVAAKTGNGPAFFLVKKKTEGLAVGQRLSMLGYDGMVISRVSLENCPVPSNCIIGPFDGEEQLKTVRMWEDQILTASSLGLIKRSLNAALTFAKDHRSGNKPIIAYQEVGFKLADMVTISQTARLLAYRAGWMAETGDREAAVLAHCAKVFCAESAEEVASHALQILSGQGYLSGNAAEEAYRDAKYLQIAGTSSEISRMKIADGVLGD